MATKSKSWTRPADRKDPAGNPKTAWSRVTLNILTAIASKVRTISFYEKQENNEWA